MKLKICALFLSCILLILSFFGCSGKVDPTDSTDKTGITTQNMISVVLDGKSEYVILRSANASEETVSSAVRLRDTIKQKLGVTLKIMNDLDAESEKAIIVGSVDRESVAAATGALKYTDYIIKAIGDDVLICGGSDEKTTEAVDYFISQYIVSNEILNLSVDLDVTVKTEHIGDSVSLLGQPIEHFSIVIPKMAAAIIKTEVFTEILHILGCGFNLREIYCRRTFENQKERIFSGKGKEQ